MFLLFISAELSLPLLLIPIMTHCRGCRLFSPNYNNLAAARGVFGCGVWDPVPRPGTEAGPCVGSTESWPREHQGLPCVDVLSHLSAVWEAQSGLVLTPCGSWRPALLESSSASHDSVTWCHWACKAFVTSSVMRASRDCCSELPAPSWVALGSCVQNTA